MGQVLLKGWKCERCGHEWLARGENKDTPPTTCPNPKCRSPYWNKPRKATAKGRAAS